MLGRLALGLRSVASTRPSLTMTAPTTSNRRVIALPLPSTCSARWFNSEARVLTEGEPEPGILKEISEVGGGAFGKQDGTAQVVHVHMSAIVVELADRHSEVCATGNCLGFIEGVIGLVVDIGEKPGSLGGEVDRPPRECVPDSMPDELVDKLRLAPQCQPTRAISGLEKLGGVDLDGNRDGIRFVRDSGVTDELDYVIGDPDHREQPEDENRSQSSATIERGHALVRHVWVKDELTDVALELCARSRNDACCAERVECAPFRGVGQDRRVAAAELLVSVAPGARVVEHRPVWGETVIDVAKLGALGGIREHEDGVRRVARNDAAGLNAPAILQHEVCARDDVTCAKAERRNHEITVGESRLDTG